MSNDFGGKKRSELPDEVFGIPQERKYPMPDEKHTRSAIKLFNHVEPKYEEQLAKAVIKNMKKYNIDGSVVGPNNRLRKYLPKDMIKEYVEEACKDLIHARKLCNAVRKLARKYNANYFFVTDGASSYSNGNGKHNPAAKEMRDHMDDWERNNGFNPDDDWTNDINNVSNYRLSKESSIKEGFLKSDKDIYYNKDKFDSGEINLCFITGLSGSGKSTMGRNMTSDKVEHYEMDDVICNDNFSDDNLKEYGGLISSFFKGSGKSFRLVRNDNKHNDSVFNNHKNYEKEITQAFVRHAISYCKSHTNIKYVCDGIWIFMFIKPSQLKDCAVYIKGTSSIKSGYRALKRDIDEDKRNGMTSLQIFKHEFKRVKEDVLYAKENQKELKSFRSYFEKQSTNESVSSTVSKDHKQKGHIKLSSLKKVRITEYLIDKYKKEYPVLRHVRCKDTDEYVCDGYMWFKDDNLVCHVGSCQYTDDNTKWIVSLEILPEYRGYGLSTQILDFCVKSMKCKYLSVNKNNELAKKIYDKYGFKVYHEDKTMYYMTLDSIIKESSSRKITMGDEDEGCLYFTINTHSVKNIGETYMNDNTLQEETRIEDNKLPKHIYHISYVNHDGETFEPRTYDNDNVKNGMERKVKRVCFSDSVTRALYSIFPNGAYDADFYVHVPNSDCKVYKTTSDDIYDADITHELWIKEPVQMKCIGKIHVNGVSDKTHTIDVDKDKAGYGKKKYHETRWNWVEKYEKDEALYESYISEDDDMINEGGYIFTIKILPIALKSMFRTNQYDYKWMREEYLPKIVNKCNTAEEVAYLRRDANSAIGQLEAMKINIKAVLNNDEKIMSRLSPSFIKKVQQGKVTVKDVDEHIRFLKGPYKKMLNDKYKEIKNKSVKESSISEYSATAGTMVGSNQPDSVYIVNYMQNNVFSGYKEPRFGICKKGMKDLHVLGDKDKKLHHVSDRDKFKEEASDIKVYRYRGKPKHTFYDIIENTTDNDKDIYKLITGRDIENRKDIDLDEEFVREECFWDELDAIKSCTEATILDQAEDLHEIPILTETVQGRPYNYYRDINGVFVQNEITKIRSKSYDSIDDIPLSEIDIIKRGYLV